MTNDMCLIYTDPLDRSVFCIMFHIFWVGNYIVDNTWQDLDLGIGFDPERAQRGLLRLAAQMIFSSDPVVGFPCSIPFEFHSFSAHSYTKSTGSNFYRKQHHLPCYHVFFSPSAHHVGMDKSSNPVAYIIILPSHSSRACARVCVTLYVCRVQGDAQREIVAEEFAKGVG